MDNESGWSGPSQTLVYVRLEVKEEHDAYSHCWVMVVEIWGVVIDRAPVFVRLQVKEEYVAECALL